MESTRQRILVIDDEGIILNLLIEILGRAGYNVDSATNGLEALEKITRHEKNYYDLVLSDVTMPGLSGPELLLRLRDLEIEIKFALMTGHSKNVLPENVPSIDKPFEIQILWDFVENVLAS